MATAKGKISPAALNEGIIVAANANQNPPVKREIKSEARTSGGKA
jgi:hypothetical protein